MASSTYQKESEKTMKRNKNKIPYVACDQCMAIREAWEKKDFLAFLKITKRDIEYNRILEDLKKHPNHDVLEARYEYEFDFQLAMQKEAKCPFDFKPDLRKCIRIMYRLQCIQCHEYFICPAHVLRQKGKPICGSCIVDSYYDDRYDPSADDDQKMIEDALLRKYGEC